jgi:hypothetical protein
MNPTMIRLIDLIKLAGVELGLYKIHLATSLNHNPLNAFYDGTFKEWQEDQTNRNFECDQVIGLIHLGANRWLFAGLWKVGQPTKNGNRWKYKTTEIPGLDHLVGRVIVHYHRTSRQSYRLGESLGASLLVHEIRPERLSIEDFPGYSSTTLDFSTLRIVVRQQPAAWVTALRSVAGVYLIADKSNGRHYVGSAYGEGGIWGRWEAYTKIGDGGNKELTALLLEKGADHASNFLFSILEICDLISTKDEVLARESHWKNILLSREFGYNGN